MTNNRKTLPDRDHAAERSLLRTLVHAGINFAVLQRDWDSETHGDIDIVLDTGDWPRFADTLILYSEQNNHPIVKAYEIEYGVICTVMLTAAGTIYLDTAISGARKKIFGVDLVSILDRSEVVNGIPVLQHSDSGLYASAKRTFKNSRLQPLFKKLKNVVVIFRRLRECTFMERGILVYVPYLNDKDILLHEQLRSKTKDYLKNDLRSRYLSITDNV